MSKIIKCPSCGGKGSVRRYPYYATKMPPQTDVWCERCRGMGRIEVVSGRYAIERRDVGFGGVAPSEKGSEEELG